MYANLDLRSSRVNSTFLDPSIIVLYFAKRVKLAQNVFTKPSAWLSLPRVILQLPVNYILAPTYEVISPQDKSQCTMNDATNSLKCSYLRSNYFKVSLVDLIFRVGCVYFRVVPPNAAHDRFSAKGLQVAATESDSLRRQIGQELLRRFLLPALDVHLPSRIRSTLTRHSAVGN